MFEPSKDCNFTIREITSEEKVTQIFPEYQFKVGDLVTFIGPDEEEHSCIVTEVKPDGTAIIESH